MHLSLRTKIFFTVFVALVMLFAIQHVVLSGVMREGFLSVENREVTMSVHQVADALKTEIGYVDGRLGDWAAWDDTYAYIKDKNPAYEKSNLIPTTLDSMGLNMMVFIDGSGAVVAQLGFDTATKSAVPVPASLLPHVSKGSALLTKAIEDGVSGILMLPEGPLLFAMHPILTSNREGPARGALLFGRYVDDALTARISEITHIPTKFTRIGQGVSVATSVVSGSREVEDASVSILPVNDQTIAGYVSLHDVYGDPVLTLRINVPRPVYGQGVESMMYMLLSLIVTGVVFLCVTIIALESQVLSRVSRVNADINAVTASGNPKARVGLLPGADELSNLAVAINKMLDKIEFSQYAITRQQEKPISVESTADVILLVLSEDGVVKLINPKGSELLGYKTQELIGKNWFDVCVPDYERAKVKELFVGYLAGSVDASINDNMILTKHGGELHILWHNSLLRDEEGTVVGILSSGEDITNRPETA